MNTDSKTFSANDVRNCLKTRMFASKRGISSSGRALRSQRRGGQFESAMLHEKKPVTKTGYHFVGVAGFEPYSFVLNSNPSSI